MRPTIAFCELLMPSMAIVRVAFDGLPLTVRTGRP